MVLGAISIIGAILSLMGVIFTRIPIVGVGVLLMVVGFFGVIGTLSLPWYFWVTAILIILAILKK